MKTLIVIILLSLFASPAFAEVETNGGSSVSQTKSSSTTVSVNQNDVKEVRIENKNTNEVTTVTLPEVNKESELTPRIIINNKKYYPIVSEVPTPTASPAAEPKDTPQEIVQVEEKQPEKKFTIVGFFSDLADSVGGFFQNLF